MNIRSKSVDDFAVQRFGDEWALGLRAQPIEQTGDSTKHRLQVSDLILHGGNCDSVDTPT